MKRAERKMAVSVNYGRTIKNPFENITRRKYYVVFGEKREFLCEKQVFGLLFGHCQWHAPFCHFILTPNRGKCRRKACLNNIWRRSEDRAVRSVAAIYLSTTVLRRIVFKFFFYENTMCNMGWIL